MVWNMEIFSFPLLGIVLHSMYWECKWELKHSHCYSQHWIWDIFSCAAEKGLQQLTLPRQRKIPRRIDDGNENHTFSSPKEFFHCQYFEDLDVLKGKLTRFDQPTFAILREMEKILIDSCNDEKNIVLSTEIKTLYANNLDMNKLTTQLSILSSVIEASNNDYQMGIKSVTSLNTICELFNTCKFPRSMLPGVDKLLRLYYTIPITSATAERTFSTLCKLKSYVRSTMSLKRLNHLNMLHAYKHVTEQIDLQTIAVDFINRNRGVGRNFRKGGNRYGAVRAA